jgi:hypothetical protein
MQLTSVPTSVVVAYFNGDGHLDLAVANDGTTHVSILLGNGDGTFQPVPSYGVSNNPVPVAVADFNRDGHPDLVVVEEHVILYPYAGTVNILQGNPDGTFKAHPTYEIGNADPVGGTSVATESATLPWPTLVWIRQLSCWATGTAASRPLKTTQSVPFGEI